MNIQDQYELVLAEGETIEREVLPKRLTPARSGGQQTAKGALEPK